MYLKRLSLLNYKNIRQAELEFEPGINCFVGNNGAGKTNLLDAVYYMSFCKSYFNAIDSQLICHDEDFFVLQAQYNRQEQAEAFYAGLKKNQKKQFKRNKKEYPRLSDHIGLLPLVMISPGDERLINEGSDQRRKYIDGVVSQFDKNYLALIIKYNRALTQRNALLKGAKGRMSAVEEQLDIWNDQLATIGGAIFDRRTHFIAELEPVFQKYHRFISGGDEKVGVIYHSHYQKDNFEEQLQRSVIRDVALGYTTKGVHRDDLELLLDGYPVKKTGSQGQKKTFFLAMKLAQYEFLSNHFGFAPILLLDDMFDKLDDLRASRLIELVGRETFHQIFITDTQKPRLLEIVKKTGKDFNFYRVADGEFTLDN
ncbi:DNA replication/repair protein RecF [Geofilum rubicundum]|uniref:DNA replication and repair protein RecF n=1 Tax=Geofilum rubicundum JCM 15548 TaxID=1236989 RepID=A0A0E9LVD3_9BACT|nr:DNA replication/repair protein RecF [Geofilum rubicundum]GAO28830.1 DNA recombination and repair protein RecF [Geofilum rubicundum JCM 15548]